jgi:ATP-dependent Clp protease ATP-binding subunit ClpA
VLLNPQDPGSSLSKLASLERHLLEHIRGQKYVIPRLAAALQRSELGLCKSGLPKGSFLFLGPTGVGKTEVTIAFTCYLLGSRALFRFDMSEYQLQESLGLLLDSIASAHAQCAKGTLLFDEIEKAHPRLLDVFLQILDAARVTTTAGETLDLSGFYVVLTSTLASTEVLELQHSTFATLERHVLARAQQHMRPELYARISEKLVFCKLSYDVQVEIARMFMDHEVTFLHERGHVLVPNGSVLPFLVRRGFHPRLGARPLRDAVERYVGDAVVRDLIAGGTGNGELVVDAGGERLRVG